MRHDHDESRYLTLIPVNMKKEYMVKHIEKNE